MVVTTKTSNRLIAGTIAMISEAVAMAAPVAEQIGHTCESSVREFKSTQQCNCAARKMIPRSKARSLACFEEPGIYLVRRSLGPTGCSVKRQGHMYALQTTLVGNIWWERADLNRQPRV